MIRQRRHPMARAALEIGEQDRGLLVEMDRIIGDPRLAQQLCKLRPERVMAAGDIRRRSRD